jgi:hypothetical protein
VLYVAAAYSLGRIGAKAEAAVPRLIALLDGLDGRFAAVNALGLLGPAAKDAVPQRRTLVKNRNRHFGRAAAAALAKIEGKDGDH